MPNFAEKKGGHIFYYNKEIYVGILQTEKYVLRSKKVYFPD